MAMGNTHESLGIKIKKFRKNKNLSTAELANRLNVSAGLINNIENARNDVFNLQLLNKIIDELDISINDLFDIKTYSIEEINLDLNKARINQYSSNISVDTIQNCSNEILQEFFNTISQLGCSTEGIESITNHLKSELQFIKRYHNQVKKSS